MNSSHFVSRVALLLCLGCMGVRHTSAQDNPGPTRPDIALPKNDSQYKASKGYVEEVPLAGYQHASAAAYEAFRDLKYGVRIHWGIYAAAGDADPSWPFLKRSYAQKQSYNELYKTWNPNGFDAEEWMQTFQDDGMKMFAFTAKHHEGFSMFDTRTRVKRRADWTAPGGPVLEDCDLAYSIMETPFHRDVVKEVCDAGRRHGLAVDLYFSNPDWYDADFRPYISHPVEVAKHPGNGQSSLDPKGLVFENAPAPTPEERARMMTRYRQQLTELLTHYGKIDMLCLDMWLGKEVWPAMRDTMFALRKLQPDVMLRARGIGNYGDYYTPERFVPGGKENTEMPWFVIYPLGTSFAYDPNAKAYKGGEWIVRNLIDTVAKGGNFMVAVGPDGNGRFSPTALENLKTAGDWLKVNGESIYATRPYLRFHEGADLRFTRSKDEKFVYIISLKWPGGTLRTKQVKPQPGSIIRMIGSSRDLQWHQDGDELSIEMPAEMEDESKRPCKQAYAFKVESQPWATFAASLPAEEPSSPELGKQR